MLLSRFQLLPLTRALALAVPGLALGLVAPAALATNGYFSHGYGAKAQGQAGVGIAWAQDGLAAATNPAGTVEVGDQFDLGLAWFKPSRGAEIVGNAFGADASYSGDGKTNFFVPELGWTKQLSSTLGAGVAVYGNGGLNTQYDTNPYGRFGATGTAGVNLEQLFITPSIAWKPAADQSVGAAINIAYQRFAATGVGFFGGFSSSAANVSDQGTDTSVGAGLRLGWDGAVAPGLKLGATWASRIHGRFDKYRGLFADGGRFDVPENYGVGGQWQINPQWSLGADWQAIRYSKVTSVGDSLAPLLQGVPLGAANGPGFGWRDIHVTKLALANQINPALTLRAGYSHANQVVPAGETFFNILAPGVIKDHYTLGGSGKVGSGELTGFFAYGRGQTVIGVNSIPPGNPPGGFGGGNVNVRLKETILGLSYAWKL
jgi:long-chain fatty acid transport protein